MRKIKLLLALGVLGVWLWQPGIAANKHYTLVNGERDFYYGFISYIPEELGTRAPEIIRAGLTQPEAGRLNVPLGPGDLIITYDKPCEIQFDSGTIIRLGTETRLKIETIMAQSLSSNDQLSNLLLEKGQVYLMYTAYNSWEVFQLLTANTALKMKNKTVLVARVTEEGETWLTVKVGKASLLYGRSSAELKSLAAKKGTSLIIDSRHQVQVREGFPELADFETWNAELNKNFEELHRGLTRLPKPIQKLPPAVFYFAQYYSNQYGEWIWDDYFGYVWRPFYNDSYPWGNWSPYYYGNWTYLNGQLFWVPAEPWGWVPYHLGIWQWDKKKGWVWIPGSAFAPAWAVWDFYFGYYTWRPWFLYDWLYYYGYGYGYGYWDPYYQGGSGIIPGDGSDQPALRKITKDQLKKPQIPNIPIPDSYKKMVASLAKAIKTGDQEVLKRISARPPEPMVVKPEDLGAPNLASRKIPVSEVVEKIKQTQTETGKTGLVRGTAPAWNRAVFHFLDAKNKAEPSSSVASESRMTRAMPVDKQQLEQRGRTAGLKSEFGPATGASTMAELQLPAGSSVRFRDWNPDLQTAQKLGVSIVYDSSRNAVVSPELRLTSREARQTGIRITPQGLVQYAPAEGSGASGSDSYSRGNSTSSTSAPSRSGSVSRDSGKERSSGNKASSSGNEKH
uniref:DUF6600 domain-containing protein n=1 Tax=Candidatus Saccharicenans sp. TaxID=2819258 RepID=UPI00404B508E